MMKLSVLYSEIAPSLFTTTDLRLVKNEISELDSGEMNGHDLLLIYTITIIALLELSMHKR